MEDTSKTLAALPDEVYDILDRPSQARLAYQLAKGAGLPADAVSVLLNVTYDVAEGRVTVQDLPQVIGKAFSLESQKAQQVAEQFFQMLLAPLVKYLPRLRAPESSETPEGFVRAKLQENNLLMPDRVLQDRFEKILVGFVTKAISKERAMESLTRPVKVGGLDLDEAASAQLLEGFAPAFASPTPAGRSNPEVVSSPGRGVLAPPIPEDRRGHSTPPAASSLFPMVIEKIPKFDPVTISPDDEKEVQSHAQKIEKMAVPEKTAEQIAKEKQAYVAKRAEKFLPVPPAPPAPPSVSASARSPRRSSPEIHLPVREVASPPPAVRKSVSAEKPRVQDVIAPRRIVGPTDELKQMTLDDFRRSATRAEGSTEKIREILRLLEGESYMKRLEGIAAWRQSPLMQMYTALLADAIAEAKPIPAILASRKAAGENTLTPEETQALLSLNASIRV